MKLRSGYFIALSILTLSCSSNSGDSSSNSAIETFMPQIKDDGTKLFTYDIVYLEVTPQRGNSARSGSGKGSRGGAGSTGTRNGAGGRSRGGSGGRSASPSQSVAGADLDDRVQSYIDTLGYCEGGFVEFERQQIDSHRFSVRGECLDSATAKDRETFISVVADQELKIETIYVD